MKPRIVVSGVNLIEAGPLSIFADALDELSRNWATEYEIVALVHSRQLFAAANVTYLEYPRVKPSWLRRLFFEYWQCQEISEELRPRLWLALHDITPRVSAPVRAVYCHNAAPFYRPGVREVASHWRFGLFTLFYGLVYRINMHANNYVIVQQQWLREEFARRYQPQAIIVAHPAVASFAIPSNVMHEQGIVRFLYPALPRSFKNIEIILEAARILASNQVGGFEIVLTVDGSESGYAADLRAEFGDLSSVRWLGRVPRERVLELYAECDCLLFPSKLETWGLPISEFKQTGKPMLLADLPYAHETAGSYSSVHFFAPQDAAGLAGALEAYLDGTLAFDRTIGALTAPLFAANWHELFETLLADGDR